MEPLQLRCNRMIVNEQAIKIINIVWRKTHIGWAKAFYLPTNNGPVDVRPYAKCESFINYKLN